MKNFRQAYEAFLKQLNERGGYDYDDIGQGHDTSDAVTKDDINGKLREISSQVSTLDTWLTDFATADELVDDLGGRDENEVWDDLSKLQQTINGFIGEYKVEESSYTGAAAGGVPRDDDYRGEDPEPRETDQDRYGYPGDRG